jgi:DNA-binding winged helix-turn-helix (wHTH) protein
MQKQEPGGRFVRFGSFEADLKEGKLTKNGYRIRLQEQPFRILALLLERPGQLITREEIRHKLWSHDTFVEFDDALNTSVRKLREALNDSVENPRFLETVRGQGYRFLAPIAWRAEPQVAVPIASRVRRNPYLWLATALIVAGAGDGVVQGERAGRVEQGGVQVARRTGRIAGDYTRGSEKDLT